MPLYIYISAVKISALTQAINFFSLTRLNYLTLLTQGRGLGLATPLITANSVTFFLDKKCIYSVTERLYEHIKQETFQTCAPASLQHQARVKRARKLYCARSACSSIHGQRCRRTHSLYHFISNRERNYEHAMSWSVSHEVTKRRLKLP